VVSVGVEALGQNLLATVATLFSLAIGLIVPLVTAWLTVALIPETRAIRLMLMIIVAAVVLGIETYGAMRLLGRALSRAEPSQTA
jgi:hypothetical protein